MEGILPRTGKASDGQLELFHCHVNVSVCVYVLAVTDVENPRILPLWL